MAWLLSIRMAAFHSHGCLSRQLTAAFEGNESHNASLEGKRLIYMVLNTESGQLPALDNIKLQNFFLSPEELQKLQSLQLNPFSA